MSNTSKNKPNINDEIQLLTERAGKATTISQMKPLIIDLIKTMSNIYKQQQQTIIELQTELSGQNKQMMEKIDTLLAKTHTSVQNLPRENESFTNTSLTPITSDEKERLRSIVIYGIKESGATTPSLKMHEDHEELKSLFDTLEVEVAIDKHYRMGKTGDQPRPIKCVFACSKHQKSTLKASRGSNRPQHIKIRPSYNKEQRQVIAKKRQDIIQLKELHPNVTFVVYAGEVCTPQVGSLPVPFNYTL
uniref:Transposase n=1 Tax=Panagrolaimus davidi TaxID=227884 RepID=A0A914PWI0_9BILA